MPVQMMHIRKMRVFVADRFVDVNVAVGLAGRAIVLV
jgi:hypothetical protein